jgi:dihydrofolate reductase
MRKLVVFEWMSLDGVVQAPAYSDEDTSGGFKHGGWHLPYFDERSMKWVVDTVSGAGGFLFGRRTYDVFAAHWPNASEEEQALARPLNTLLVDEVRLMIDPIILGGGKRFFHDDGVCRRLTLAESETTSTGAILATYARSRADAPAGASAVPLPRPPRGR